MLLNINLYIFFCNYILVQCNALYIYNSFLQVKRSIMLKMADACQRAGGQASTSATRFHELHVQRHTNVTILFADIVNFTPLSSSLTASDLVKTLNDLFGRFDQIAQVKILFRNRPWVRNIIVNRNKLLKKHKLLTKVNYDLMEKRAKLKL